MPPTANRDFQRRLRSPAYVFLIVTLAIQFFDYLYNVAPFRFESVVWRFGSLGGAANSVGNFLLLILLIYAVAVMFADRHMLLFVGCVSALMAAFLFVGSGSFVLDALQLRARVDATGIHKFDLATGQAFAKLATEAIVATIFAINALRAYAALRREMLRDDRTVEAPIVARASTMRAP